ncbi:MAG: hypothetical protein WCJ13_01360 [Coriobacteriia bacterium]
MKKTITAVLLVGVALSALALTGCSSAPKMQADTTKVWGYVAAPDKAQLDVAADQNGVKELVVKRVLSPTDGWVVVHADMNGKPGMRVGLAPIKRGESLDVKVPLKDLTTPKVIVALHADKGTAGTFDFDMMNKEMSPDRPFFVGGAELAKVVTVRDFGVKVGAGTASITALEQLGLEGQPEVVANVKTPTDAWIVVHLEKDGGPGQRIGLVHVLSGETSGVVVPLEPVKLTPKLIVALHADKGDPGLFEFDMDDKINSLDQPFFVGGKEVAVTVPVK